MIMVTEVTAAMSLINRPKSCKVSACLLTKD
jgi:hypothetical protein